MAFKHAIKLLHQRRREVVRQMEISVQQTCYTNANGHPQTDDTEYQKIRKVYVEIMAELLELYKLEMQRARQNKQVNINL